MNSLLPIRFSESPTTHREVAVSLSAEARTEWLARALVRDETLSQTRTHESLRVDPGAWKSVAHVLCQR